jgi:hypothetical protein
MKKVSVFLFVALFFACSQSPTSVNNQKSDTLVVKDTLFIKDTLGAFTICNVMAGQAANIYYGHYVGGSPYSDSLLCTVSVGACVPVDIADGRLLVYAVSASSYGKSAAIVHKGEYWNL